MEGNVFYSKESISITKFLTKSEIVFDMKASKKLQPCEFLRTVPNGYAGMSSEKAYVRNIAYYRCRFRP